MRTQAKNSEYACGHKGQVGLQVWERNVQGGSQETKCRRTCFQVSLPLILSSSSGGL